MKNLRYLALIGIGAIAGGCASATNTNTSSTTSAGNTNLATVAGNSNSSAGRPAGDKDETPAAVRAVFTDAQSFTTQHKQLTDEQVASIEQASGGEVTEKDFHSYLAFTTTGGTRRQIGAATLIKVDDRDLIVVYESKGGMPTIKEVRSEGVSPEFLKQFIGKNHDAEIAFGKDVNPAGGIDEATARSITQAVRTNVLTMEELYGAPHSH